uniref:Peptidoglycan glycosyltransferase n=1 Tax=Cyanothece sp. (strain PCC 7425 / ATCC 29141) TaxID=395961 RepID=B8HTI7_CYAP4
MASTTPRPSSPPPSRAAIARRRRFVQTRAAEARPSQFRSRLLVLAVLLLLGQLGLLARLFYLQVRQSDKLRLSAQRHQLIPLPPQIARYPIVDRNGDLLAVDKPAFTLFAHPMLFKEPLTTVAEQLAPLVNKPVAELEKELRSGPSGIPLVYELSEETASRIRGLYLDGLELVREWQRVYPQAELTSGIVGYVDREHKGQAGLEFSQEKLLQVPPKERQFSGDGDGFLLPDLAPTNPIDPASTFTLRLTIDTRLQRVARTALRQQLKKFNALRGTAIVMDARDGSLLALAAEPSFNPQEYYKADPSLFRNWAVADLYEPGSTFKPVNTAIALQAGVVQPSSTLYDEGRISVGGWPIQNNDFSSRGGRGTLTLPEVLGYSSNVAMVHMMSRLPATQYYTFLKRLGVGEKTGSDLAFETPGQFKPKEQFVNYPIEPATTAFGQGFSVTPVQMVQLLGTMANGGKLVTPHVIAGLFDRDNQKVKSLPLPPPRQVFSPTVSRQVLNMMGYVVTDGTGKAAQIPGYRLGGKTGTAQKAVGGIYSNARITSFVGIFPLEAPRYVLLAVVDEPKGDDAYGSTVALPIVKAVTESLITIAGIPPSHPKELERSSP